MSMQPETPMRALFVHNYYQQPGGEDQIFAAESALLEEHGHEVVRYTAHNASVASRGRLDLALNTTWNAGMRRELRALMRRVRPAVLHCHNTFPLISPSAYQAARDAGVPVVQSLHNYRLICPNALLFRDGRPCEDCVGKAVPWPGIVHGCYRGSRAASAAVTAMLGMHRMRSTWSRDVDVYIVMTEFARRKLSEGGLPAERLVIKPNFLHPDPGRGAGRGGYALFVGRLAPEKGIETLLDAWKHTPTSVPLKIVGDGPLAPLVAAAAGRHAGIEWLGARPRAEVLAIMQDATLLVFPSLWYEGLPVTIVEALAVGLPVVASGLGAMPELIEDGRNGVLFRPGDARDLAAGVQALLDEPGRLHAMRDAARACYEERYTAERNYEALMRIYALAAERARSPEVA